MPTGYQIEDQDGLYYFTFQVVEWIDIFTRQAIRNIIIESLQYCQQNKGLILYGWVVMSNHLHLLAQSKDGNISGFVRDFKKHTSKGIIEYIQNEHESRRGWMLKIFSENASKTNRNKDFQVWTHENHCIRVYTDAFVKEKLEYIHNNPVRAGIVEQPEHYIYSSAKNYAGEKGWLHIETLSIKWKSYS
jgi:REP element-mobilizing transposase RayT